ncbi:MAG TPA: aminotransferase class V-fold PLP-dependent enzyme [Alcanivoracaceae bacterium]|nr:aminotransferase class V-fold PLP-dependent enzyme [Alcanivoracaceae bacterium]
MKPVYLDYAATTPVDPEVIAVMQECLGQEGIFGNPASRSHLYGWLAEEQVEEGRASVAELINADAREIIWTSGATEAINLGIKGAAFAAKHQGGGEHIVTSTIEHKAVLDTVNWLAQQGFRVSKVAPNEAGEITAEAVAEAMTEDTVLVSIMHANNETGVINDIAAIGAVVREKDAIFHVDAAQTLGKLPLDMAELPVDLLSVSGHKIYGPKGIGALYVRRRPGLRVEAQIHGGGHERGMRSGTLATHQIAGFGKACAIAKSNLVADSERISALRDRLWQGLQVLPNVSINGGGAQRLPGHLNVAFSGVNGDLLLASLTGVAASSGSACTSASVAPSYVLKAMGLTAEDAHSSLRFSVGRFTTEEEIDRAVSIVVESVERLLASS